MSAAVMSSSVYDFGDTLLKSHNSSAGRHQHGQHGGVRWADARVAGVLDYQREGLSRRASNPVTSAPPPGLAALNMTHALVLQLDTQPQSPPAPAPVTPTPTLQAVPPAHRKLDRSHSEPANAASVCKSAAAAAAAAANINTSRYKTELCRPYEESGSCKYGDKCQFAHGAHELRTLVRHPKYKTELCRTYHTIGLCPYGPRCHFVHNDEEVIGHAKPSMQNAMPAAMANVGPTGVPNGVPTGVPRPKALTLATAPLPAHAAHAAHSPAHSYLGGSTADSPSPTSSLSQSPTNSHRSFFMSSEDVFGSGSVSPTPSSATANTAFSFGQDFGLVQSPPVGHHAPCGSGGSTGSGSSRDSPSPPGSPFRLPIFNTLSNQVLNIRLDA
ncbi:mRNA decay activator protein ZFP36L1 [Thrips palmi]|uniref:mRNA decay activator protein ZFP36L1 n=1 Tax=Thrips palmi TaxID=161013 RepID=A0A6P8Y8R0_THRPL|nr:mRNA decay activator protein ZFP36L1 [Thrips palmi]